MVAAEVYAGLSALKAAFDIAKGLKDIDDATRRNGAVIELQEKMLAAQAAQAELLDSVRALEAEVARLKAWDAEKERYELKPIGPGTVAYILKPEARGAETPHWLCPNCYAKGQKAFLQSTNKTERTRLLVGCNSCGTTEAITKDVRGWAD